MFCQGALSIKPKSVPAVQIKAAGATGEFLTAANEALAALV
jgi:hypothetical protein